MLRVATFFVALYTSAWIEIRQKRRNSSFSRLVALYTSAWIEILVSLKTGWSVSVALYTSAWIEIFWPLKEMGVC